MQHRRLGERGTASRSPASTTSTCGSAASPRYTNLFGGLLGTTFNYVFETQLTNLQNGDRFYYLARTPGMNLRTQLEGNSFAELVMRNTTAHTLKADPFATADCKFELGNLVTAQGSAGKPITRHGSVHDDPTQRVRRERSC